MMNEPYVVEETTQPIVAYARMPSETHDHIPAVADNYVVTFTAGRPVGRIVHRDIPTLLDALRIKYDLDEAHGKYGRRSLIHAIVGFRSYHLPC
jgi:hypothetical protein